MKPAKTYYEILGVSPSAEPFVIKAAYRALSQRYHPDRRAGDAAAEQRMAMINLAYSILSNEDSRIAYDRETFGEGRDGTSPIINGVDVNQLSVVGRMRNPPSQNFSTPATPQEPIQKHPNFNLQHTVASRAKIAWLIAAAFVVILSMLFYIGDDDSIYVDESIANNNKATVVAHLKKAASLMHPESGRVPDLQRAITELEMAEKLGSSEAKRRLSEIYRSPIYEQLNEKKGVELLSMAAQEGNQRAQTSLGTYYLYTERDHARAVFWLERAAYSGSKDAQFSLGNAYDQNNSADDRIKAYAWFWVASDVNYLTSSAYHRNSARSLRQNGMKALELKMTDQEHEAALSLAGAIKKKINARN